MVISVKYKKENENGHVIDNKLVTSLDCAADRQAVGDYIYNAYHSGRKPGKIIIKECPTVTSSIEIPTPKA